MSGVKNLIQQENKGLEVPTNEDYREVGTGENDSAKEDKAENE